MVPKYPRFDLNYNSRQTEENFLSLVRYVDSTLAPRGSVTVAMRYTIAAQEATSSHL